MAIAFDAVSAEQTTVATSLTFSHTVGASGTWLFVYALSQTNDVTGVTYGGVAMTRVGSAVQQPTNSFYLSLWHLRGPLTGANNVVISTTNSETIYGGASSYSGSIAVALDNSGSGSTATLALTTVHDNAWVVMAVAVNAATPTPTGASTSRISGGSGVLLCDTNAAKTPPGAVTLGTTSGTTYGGVIAAISPRIASMLAVF